jgi:hypothetical protein
MKCIGFISEDNVAKILTKAKRIFNATTGELVQARRLENDSWDFFKNEKTYERWEHNFPKCDNVEIPVRQDDSGNLFLEFINWNENIHYFEILDRDINLYDYYIPHKR